MLTANNVKHNPENEYEVVTILKNKENITGERDVLVHLQN